MKSSDNLQSNVLAPYWETGARVARWQESRVARWKLSPWGLPSCGLPYWRSPSWSSAEAGFIFHASCMRWQESRVNIWYNCSIWESDRLKPTNVCKKQQWAQHRALGHSRDNWKLIRNSTIHKQLLATCWLLAVDWRFSISFLSTCRVSSVHVDAAQEAGEACSTRLGKEARSSLSLPLREGMTFCRPWTSTLWSR